MEVRVTDDPTIRSRISAGSDFEVTDDGERQTIAAFTLVTAASLASTNRQSLQ